MTKGVVARIDAQWSCANHRNLSPLVLELHCYIRDPISTQSLIFARRLMTKDVLVRQLYELADSQKTELNLRFYKGGDPGTVALGVPIGKIFSIASLFSDISIADIKEMLEDTHYEVRLAAAAVMDYKARHTKTTQDDRKALFNLYLGQHARIDNWDMVDRAAPSVIGDYLLDRNRAILYKLARSKNCNKRRTAIVSTLAFVERGQVSDTYLLANGLIGDENRDVLQAIEYCLRAAGKRDERGLVEFLHVHRNKLDRRAVLSISSCLTNSARRHFLENYFIL